MTQARRAPRWSADELEILRTVYVEQGLEAAMAQLPGRPRQAVYVKAAKLGLKTSFRPARMGCYRELAGQALALYAELGSYAKVGERLGVCEATATNAVLVGQCLAAGHRPIERGPDNRITRAGIERLRQLMRKGLKHRDIQLLTGVPAATLTRERRRYETYLKQHRLAPIPARNHGTGYSGNRVPAAKKREVERLFLEGFGTQKIFEATGVSKSVCLRIRAKLVAKLRRRHECLPGCDANGVRRVMRDHGGRVPQESLDKLRALLLDRVPVARAARICGIGGSSAYRIRDAMKAELGEAMPSPRLPGHVTPLRREMMNAQAIPADRLWRFRELVRDHGDDEARRLLRAEMAAARRGMTFEDQLEAVGKGKLGIVEVQEIRRPEPSFSPGGSQLAAIQ